jgi:small subunit ribosomal protein S1
VQFGNLRGFIPASHLREVPRGLQEEDRKYHLRQMAGKVVTCKILEVNQKQRRLVMSEREAYKEQREALREKLMENLEEGQVVTGRVTGMREFGAFIELGGADGLIHISELAWQRVNHPREVVSIGQELQVYVLRLDKDNNRIELSLKRMQQNPWSTVEERYHIGKLVDGTVKRVAEFGAFVVLEPGIEGLLHSNEIADETIQEGDTLRLRILSLEPENQRLGLSLRAVEEKATVQEIPAK